jgi:predicted O-methyltransferase YrrM
VLSLRSFALGQIRSPRVESSRPDQASSWRSGRTIRFRLFLLLERLGYHLLPRHFYSPVADRHWLERHPEFWRPALSLPGVDLDIDPQLAWLRETCVEYLDEVSGFPFLTEGGATFGYGPIEGQVLHCVVRKLAPPRVVEVGSGSSTMLIAAAASRNRNEGRGETRIVTIDPYPPVQVRSLPRVELLEMPAQAVPDAVFEELTEGDLLFIDSSHAVKAGSELPRLYLELVPALAPGVTIQIHDIFLPYSNSPGILRNDLWDWQETTLVAALMSGNPRLKVLCCLSALHDEAPERLAEILPDYEPLPMNAGLDTGERAGHYPSSLWLRTASSQ